MKTKLIFIIAIIFSFTEIFSQTNGSSGLSDARSLGMAGTYINSAKGLYSIGINPANLSLDTTATLEIIAPVPLPKVAAKVGTNFMSLDEYNYFFGYSTTNENGDKVGRYLTENDKTRLKNLFKDGGSIFIDQNVQLFGIALNPSNGFGTLAFTIGDVISAKVTVPKNLVVLGLDGNKLNTVYNFSDMDLKSWWLRKYALSYSNSFDIIPGIQDFSFGVSLNFIKGYSYLSIDKVKTELTTNENYEIVGRGSFVAHSAFSPDFGVKYDFDNSPDKTSKFSVFPEPAGTGFGLDFGFTAKIDNVFSAGLAFTDLGKITWEKNVAEYKSDKPFFLDDPTNQNQRDSLVDALKGKDSGKFIDKLETELASAMRIGFSAQVDQMFDGDFPGTMIVDINLNKGFNNQPGNSTNSRLSLGIDWNLTSLFAFRTGLSFGGIDKFNWGLGLGFDFGIFEINLGSPDFHYLLSPNSAKRLTVGLDSRWKF
ncbi:MAG: hypothetical protein Fur0015_05870 [Ignavibacteriales bacterium]